MCREVLKRGGKVEGFDAVFAGNGAEEILGSDVALHRFEHLHGGVTQSFDTEANCGIMDQFASVFGKKDHLMRLDCRSMEYEYYPFDPKGHTLGTSR